MNIVELSTLPHEVGLLLSESERSGFRFVRRLVVEWESGRNRFDGKGEGLFGAYIAGRLVGICGLNTDPYETDLSIGRLRHLYVLESCRRVGVGRTLVVHVVSVARSHFRQLRLRTDTPEAAWFYERLGFHVIVSESATHVWSFSAAMGA